MSEHTHDSDPALHAEISRLVEEEHRLRSGKVGEDDRARLATIEGHLDQIWDLLRQREARRDAAENPDDARERPVGEVEGYLQ